MGHKEQEMYFLSLKKNAFRKIINLNYFKMYILLLL